MKIKIISIGEPKYIYTGEISSYNKQKLAVLTEPLECKIEFIYANRNITVDIIVPIGFITDFGSIPVFAQKLVNPRGNSDIAFIVHDWLCITEIYKSSIRDLILYNLMKHRGTRTSECIFAYIGVRCFAIFDKCFLLFKTNCAFFKEHSRTNGSFNRLSRLSNCNESSTK